MYEKNAYKIAYKCMTKTHKKSHTNVWRKKGITMYEKKHAYKCMTKTCIQMYDKNTHTNV